MMRSDLVVYLVAGVLLILLALLPRGLWRRHQITPVASQATRRKREPKPFAGYTRNPECDLCEQGSLALS